MCGLSALYVTSFQNRV